MFFQKMSLGPVFLVTYYIAAGSAVHVGIPLTLSEPTEMVGPIELATSEPLSFYVTIVPVGAAPPVKMDKYSVSTSGTTKVGPYLVTAKPEVTSDGLMVLMFSTTVAPAPAPKPGPHPHPGPHPGPHPHHSGSSGSGSDSGNCVLPAPPQSWVRQLQAQQCLEPSFTPGQYTIEYYSDPHDLCPNKLCRN
jgi:hypothetical protein